MKLTPDYIRDKLLSLGFSPSKKGFQYIVDAVMIMENDHNARYNIVKQIYTHIGNRDYLSPSAVERSIRHSILAAVNSNCEIIADYLHFQPSDATGTYRNSDFLTAFHMALHRG